MFLMMRKIPNQYMNQRILMMKMGGLLLEIYELLTRQNRQLHRIEDKQQALQDHISLMERTAQLAREEILTKSTPKQESLTQRTNTSHSVGH